MEELKRMGLTEERYRQMIDRWGGDTDEVKQIVKEWGVENCNKGYAVFNVDNKGILEIEQIDDVDAFGGDNEKAVQAAVRGIKIIPVEELPKEMPYRWYGYIDTNENRKRIAELYGK